MTDVFSLLIGDRRRARAQPNLPPRPRTPLVGPGGASGAAGVIGPVGPGAVIGAPITEDQRAAADARQSRLSRNAQDVGAAAGRLARQAQNRPIYPQESGAGEAINYPIGPGAVAATPENDVDIAARAAGVPSTYLKTLIGHESSGDPMAKASTSSAAGATQFIESQWLATMGRYGQRYGLNPDLSEQEILDLRYDPRWSALMASHLAQENARDLSGRLGRRVRQGEVYLAHVFGSKDAASLIRASQADTSLDPRGRPARHFVSEAAVRANRNIFYDRSGRERSSREVVAALSKNFDRGVF